MNLNTFVNYPAKSCCTDTIQTKNGTNNLTMYKSSSSLVKFVYTIAFRMLNRSYKLRFLHVEKIMHDTIR